MILLEREYADENLLRCIFFQTWGILTSLKSQTWVPPKGPVLKIFASLTMVIIFVNSAPFYSQLLCTNIKFIKCKTNNYFGFGFVDVKHRVLNSEKT